MTSLTAQRRSRPLRKDAERNRQIILNVAAQAFAESGLDVGFEEIARRAGVGVGTVYRRFPDREVLVEAIFARSLDEIVRLAEVALRQPDAWAGLRLFLMGSLEMQVADRGLQAVLTGTTFDGPQLTAARGRLRPAICAVVARAIESGDLRSDVEPLDLAAFSWMISTASTTGKPDLWRRYFVLMLDALRQHRSEPTQLPLHAPQEADLNELLRVTPIAHQRK